jgi:hypothetical protein
MNKLIVPKLTVLNNAFPNLDNEIPHAIAIAPWDNYVEKPIVYFKIAHDDKHIYLQYTVRETNIVAKTIANNGRVWEDSCVEMFIAPENEAFYYNFEFNCIGAKLLAVGHSRHDRVFANAAVLDKIMVKSTLDKVVFNEQKGDFNWQLDIVIPIKSFFKHEISALQNTVWTANFYKCGDGLTTPHYLSWNTIETEKPDFHTPQYFGEIKFLGD